jgi:hypothetical protein
MKLKDLRVLINDPNLNEDLEIILDCRETEFFNELRFLVSCGSGYYEQNKEVVFNVFDDQDIKDDPEIYADVIKKPCLLLG